MTKICSACKVNLPATSFYKRSASKDGLQNTCKPCQAIWNSNNIDKRRVTWAKSAHNKRLVTYGITSDDLLDAKEKQRDSCAICLIPFGPDGRAGDGCAIDHSHDTGKFRGLLCNNCNNGLGRFKDNPDYLLRAALYLQRHRSIKE